MGRTVYLTSPTKHQAWRLRTQTLLLGPRKSVALLSGRTLYMQNIYISIQYTLISVQYIYSVLMQQFFLFFYFFGMVNSERTVVVLLHK
jgi:hypothetical protein